MEKQTAVEWLISKLIEHGDLKENWRSEQFFNKAKQMEKEQIVDAHLIGLITSMEMEATKQAEQYYNETYTNEK
jgi:hypothetical protein